MKPSPLTLGAIYLTFFSLLIASGLVGNETISDALYYLAFIISSSAGVLFAVFCRKSRHGTVVNEDTASSFKFPSLAVSRTQIPLMLSIVLPVVAIVFSVSLLTAAALRFFGIENGTLLPESFPFSLLTHALFPAIFEELLFRYIPIAVLPIYGISLRRTAIISATLFALSHINVDQIPYALVAGIIFALIDIYFDSIAPSIIIHLINNVISLLMMYGYTSVYFYCVLSLILLLSVFAIVFLCKTGKIEISRIRDILSR